MTTRSIVSAVTGSARSARLGVAAVRLGRPTERRVIECPVLLPGNDGGGAMGVMAPLSSKPHPVSSSPPVTCNRALLTESTNCDMFSLRGRHVRRPQSGGDAGFLSPFTARSSRGAGWKCGDFFTVAWSACASPVTGRAAQSNHVVDLDRPRGRRVVGCPCRSRWPWGARCARTCLSGQAPRDRARRRRCRRRGRALEALPGLRILRVDALALAPVLERRGEPGARRLVGVEETVGAASSEVAHRPHPSSRRPRGLTDPEVVGSIGPAAPRLQPD